MKRKTAATLIAIAAFATVVAFWLAQDHRTFIDGYPVGGHVCPAPNEAWWCNAGTAFAAATLDKRSPGHAPVTSIEAIEADYRAPNGERLTRTYGTAAADGVFVLRLADGTVRAFYLTCLAGPWGPQESPSPDAVHCGSATPYEP